MTRSTSSEQFRIRKVTLEKKYGNYGQISTNPVYKIWYKNIQVLLCNHILGVGLFFSRTLYVLLLASDQRGYWEQRVLACDCGGYWEQRALACDCSGYWEECPVLVVERLSNMSSQLDVFNLIITNGHVRRPDNNTMHTDTLIHGQTDRQTDRQTTCHINRKYQFYATIMTTRAVPSNSSNASRSTNYTSLVTKLPPR